MEQQTEAVGGGKSARPGNWGSLLGEGCVILGLPRYAQPIAPHPELRLGDSSTTESQELASESREKASRLPEEDVLSLHEGGVTGRLSFDVRPSWSGGAIDGPMDDPLVDTTLHGTYAVSRIIGEGGMGRVYQAQHTRIASKRYAIKVLHSEFARNPDIRRRFQQEAEAAAKIEHPGIVGTYDIGEAPGGWPYIVCEYLSGEDLNDYLTKRGALSARTVVHIGKQLCSALSAAHARGVIHRDLKPHNVFVLGEVGSAPSSSRLGEAAELPQVKVLDFGLSRFVERDNDQTKTGIILGTPGYMAPEQAGAQGTDLRTDIYGIGALLYAAATGRAPFKEDTPQQTVLSVLRGVPARPRDLAPSIPVDLEIVIQRAMARSPDDRYQSAEEVALALARLERAPGADNQLASPARAALAKAPRLQFVFFAFAALALAGSACFLALLSLLETRGVAYRSFRPSTLEWFLLALLGLVLLFPVGLLVQRFRRDVWNDSARVAALVPKIKVPLAAATLVYGISAFVALSAWGIEGLRADHLGEVARASLLRWYVVLSLNALLAASAAVIWAASKKAKNTFVRALGSAGYSAGAAIAGVVLITKAVLSPVPVEEGALTASSARASNTTAQALTTKPEQERALKDPKATAPKEKADSSTDVPESESGPWAPAEELATAQSLGPDGLLRLLEKYPRDDKILKALVLAHASRAETLNRAIETISRLFEVQPASMKDGDVLFILKKGLLAPGDAHQVALEVVKTRMGTDGGELLYQLLNESPKQQDRLRRAFLELRKVNQVTPATAVAYDLRYEASCRGRLAHLERAQQDGDARSMEQLLGLSTAPKRCGWGRKCQPLCPAEAEQFQQSVEVIRQRLDRP